MHPQQPYGHPPHPQQPGQLPHPQQPNPYQTSPYQPTAYAQVKPSAITAITAAVLGVAVGLAWVGGLVRLLLTLTGIGLDDVLGIAVTVLLLVVPTLVGAVGVFARTKFGRVVLIVGFALDLPVAGLLAFAPDAPYGFGVPVLVGAVAGLVLTSSPTTGRYIRAASRYTTPPQVAAPHAAMPPAYGHPQQAQRFQPAYPQPQFQYPQYQYPQFQQPQFQQPQHPQQGTPPGY